MMERRMRRGRQLLPQAESMEILRRGKYAVWAVEGDDGYPYAVPVNYVFDGKAVFIHSASEGHKIDKVLGLGILYPTFEEIAAAIARRDKAKIVPTGIYALNQLGLSTQLPMNVVYLTEGSPTVNITRLN